MTTIGYRRARKTGKDVFVELCVSVVMSLLGGFMFMLAVGVVHHEWIAACPTIGYGWSVLLAALLRGAMYANSSTRSER